MRRNALLLLLFLGSSWPAFAQKATFNGLGSELGNLYRLSDAQTRSISPENFNGAKGKGGMATEGTGKNASRDLGQGWKVSPSVIIKAGQTITVAEINGSGAIQHIWMTPTGLWRFAILRMYWDDEKSPRWKCLSATFLGRAGARRPCSTPFR